MPDGGRQCSGRIQKSEKRGKYQKRRVSIHTLRHSYAAHLNVIEAMISYRTPVFGMTVYECAQCGNTLFIPRSCGSRHCPSCRYQKGLDWMNIQVKRQVQTLHFMVTFTVPEEIRPFIRSHQRIAYNALFKASSETMKKLVGDEKFIGGDVPGFFGVLHTWGRTLNYHPHNHYVAAGGAWSKKERKWHSSRPDFYLLVKVMSKIFRAKFKALMKEAGVLFEIPCSAWQKGWNVNVQAAGSAEQSIKYLAHYVFKAAISDHRIINCEDGKVTFKYRKPDSRRTRFMTLDALEFMRRFLQHVLPSGFMKVRHYGFMDSCSGVSLGLVRAAVELMQGFDVKESAVNEAETEKPTLCCPNCGGRMIYCCSILPHQMTPPPKAELILKNQAVQLE